MNPFRRQLIEEAWACVDQWITPIQEDEKGLYFRLMAFNPGQWWECRNLNPGFALLQESRQRFMFAAVAAALARQFDIPDPNGKDPRYSRYASSLELAERMIRRYSQDQINERIQIISDWIDQHPHGAPRMAEVESEMARDALTLVALDTMADVARPGGAVETRQRRM